MIEGYAIFEPDELDFLLKYPMHHGFAVAMLSWLITKLRQVAESEHAELEVIKVTYLGSYPAIGIKQPDHSKDITPALRNRIREVLASNGIEDFLQFVVKSEGSWDKKASDLLS